MIGIGLNVFQREFPEGLRMPATSLVLERDKIEIPPLQVLLSSLLTSLRSAGALPGTHSDRVLVDRAGSAWRAEAEALLARKGQVVRFRQELGGAELEGRLVGLAEDGALLLAPTSGDGRTIRCYSGEIESP